MNHMLPQSCIQGSHDKTAEGDKLKVGSVQRHYLSNASRKVTDRKLKRTDTAENTAETQEDGTKKVIISANAYMMFAMYWEPS